MAIEALEQEPTTKNDKIDCKHTECNNCVNHKYCDYEPTTKNDLVVDCISREQALRELKESAEHHANDSREVVLLRRDRDIIRALPSVTPQEPRKGHWIKEKSVHGWDGRSYQCSVCGRSIHLDTVVESLIDYPYCHCGAEMEEVEE